MFLPTHTISMASRPMLVSYLPRQHQGTAWTDCVGGEIRTRQIEEESRGSKTGNPIWHLHADTTRGYRGTWATTTYKKQQYNSSTCRAASASALNPCDLKRISLQPLQEYRPDQATTHWSASPPSPPWFSTYCVSVSLSLPSTRSFPGEPAASWWLEFP